jgi:uncharacterized protein YbjT (DUF2867 family)
MANKRIIAVIGATGAQGGGLARAILADPGAGFVVRAITRKPDSDKAQVLAELGAAVVAADLDDADSLRAAFEGVHGVFCVTNFWEHFSPDKERAQARNTAEAARDCGVKHVIWSTLEDVRKWYPLADDSMPTLMGRYKVPHFDGKGAADHLFTDLGVPTTFLRVAFYWENLIYFGMGPRRNGSGALTFTMPLGEGKLPSIGAEDIGRCAFGIFKGGRRYIGETIGIAGEHLTGDEMAQALGRALKADVRYQHITPSDYRGLGFPGAEDLGNMFQFQLENNEEFCRLRSVAKSKELNPGLRNFSEWLAANAARIPIA